MYREMVFVDGEEDVEILNTILKRAQIKVISFDFHAHKKLEILGIKHNLVEEYITRDDEENIDNLAVILTKNWYLQNDLTKFLNYNEINIGFLLEHELLGFLFINLKRIFGIIRIIEKENPNKIFASLLGTYAENICNRKKIELLKLTTRKKSDLFYDIIEIPIRFNKKIITIRISRKKYFKIKKLILELVKIIYPVKIDFKKLRNEKLILVSEYNPVMYERLVEKFSESKCQVLLLNQRRPAIWNYRSLNVIKNSKIKIIEIDDWMSNPVAAKIEKDKIIIKNLIDILDKNDDVFSRIFTIDDYSFWRSIKLDFSRIIRDRFFEFIEKYNLMEEMLKKLDVHCVLEWSHVGFEDRILLSLIKKRGIPSIFLQHGLYIQNKKFDKYITLQPILPTNISKHAVWGDILKEHIIKNGGDEKNILTIGSPRHDDFFSIKPNLNSNVILLAANNLFSPNFQGSDTRAIMRIESFTIRVLEILKKFPDKRIVIKLHTGRPYFDIRSLISKIDPHIEIFQEENILDLLKNCHSMISFNYSTVIIDSAILGIPTLVLLPEKQDFEREIPIEEGVVLSTSDEDQIEDLITKLINDNFIRDELIRKGSVFIDKYIVNHGKASEKLIEVLEKL